MPTTAAKARTTARKPVRKAPVKPKTNVRVLIIKTIVKAYFLGALIISFGHIVETAHKLGLTGAEALSVPFAIDGIAVIGIIMRTDWFSKRNQEIGFKVQIGAGLLSLVCNIYAGSNAGEYIYGVLIVALFVFAEWLSGQIEGREVDEAAAHRAKIAAAVAKGRATREAKRRAQDAIVKTSRRRMNAELAAITG